MGAILSRDGTKHNRQMEGESLVFLRLLLPVSTNNGCPHGAALNPAKLGRVVTEAHTVTNIMHTNL
jgi:hypothetical protein